MLVYPLGLLAKANIVIKKKNTKKPDNYLKRILELQKL